KPADVFKKSSTDWSWSILAVSVASLLISWCAMSLYPSTTVAIRHSAQHRSHSRRVMSALLTRSRRGAEVELLFRVRSASTSAAPRQAGSVGLPKRAPHRFREARPPVEPTARPLARALWAVRFSVLGWSPRPARSVGGARARPGRAETTRR